ncbi:MAG: hypothetical protein FE045_04855 [Thermoplasmata archaeon]|nr:MAG: hypothetical protein FE045_04855 [Thermoplasmata archaeon]HDN95757.1 hypothetical protein [Thermoplasmatales archaeon]
MMTKEGMRCPECGSKMTKHEFGGRVYYICPKCGKEIVMPLSFL